MLEEMKVKEWGSFGHLTMAVYGLTLLGSKFLWQTFIARWFKTYGALESWKKRLKTYLLILTLVKPCVWRQPNKATVLWIFQRGLYFLKLTQSLVGLTTNLVTQVLIRKLMQITAWQLLHLKLLSGPRSAFPFWSVVSGLTGVWPSAMSCTMTNHLGRPRDPYDKTDVLKLHDILHINMLQGHLMGC